MAAATSRGPDAGHTSSSKLEDQAATAALYVTKTNTTIHGHPILDEHGRLSSAGAAASLTYAKPQDLPSFPSAGLKLSSAGAAASLANSNRKNIELWKPGSIPAAEKAAFLAKDYEADPLWQPELSSAGSKAALLAAKEGAHVEIWKPEESDYGSSAAGQAFRKKGLSPTVQRGVDSDGSRRALLAATGAMSGSRRRAGSSPAAPVDSPAALSAAASSTRNPRKVPPIYDGLESSLDASRLHNMAKSNVNREMYTSHPPVAIEVEEKNRQDTLRAAAVSMAKQMYSAQQAALASAAGVSRSDSHRAANTVHNRRLSTNSAATVEEPASYPQYVNLQEAAQKLASERLAKLYEEHDSYRKHYGTNPPPRSRLSIRPRNRRRASSDGELGEVDEEQSRKIRSEMSVLQQKLAEVDTKKRQRDRDALLEAARRNVDTSMHNMDEKLFADTGKASPAMMAQWESEARARAEKDSQARMVNYGKIHIGGGKYLDQAEVDAIAKTRLQPTLNEISEKAEAQRARDEEIRLEQEQQKRQAALEKQRAADLKADQKKAEYAEKEERRIKKEEEKQEEKERKRRLKEAAKIKVAPVDPEPPTLGTIPSTEPITTEEIAAEIPTTTAEDDISDEEHGPHETEGETPAVVETTTAEETTSASPKGESKVKSWFKGRFGRSSKSASKEGEAGAGPKSTFAGGAALAGETSDTNPDSVKEVALAGRSNDESGGLYSASDVDEDGDNPANEMVSRGRTLNRSPSISSLDSEGKKPKRGGLWLRKNPAKDSDDDGGNDEFEEARDTFDEKLAPPPTFASAGEKASSSPIRDSKFSEDL